MAANNKNVSGPDNPPVKKANGSGYSLESGQQALPRSSPLGWSGRSSSSPSAGRLGSLRKSRSLGGSVAASPNVSPGASPVKRKQATPSPATALGSLAGQMNLFRSPVSPSHSPLAAHRFPKSVKRSKSPVNQRHSLSASPLYVPTSRHVQQGVAQGTNRMGVEHSGSEIPPIERPAFLHRQKGESIETYAGQDSVSSETKHTSEATVGDDGGTVSRDTAQLLTRMSFIDLNTNAAAGARHGELMFVQLPTRLPMMCAAEVAVPKQRTGSHASVLTPVASLQRPETTMGPPSMTGARALRVEADDSVSIDKAGRDALQGAGSGFVGTVLVYKSGRVRLQVGAVFYELRSRSQLSCHEEVVAVAPGAETRAMYRLGDIRHHLSASLDMDQVLSEGALR